MNVYTVAARDLKKARKAYNDSLIICPNDRETAEKLFDKTLFFAERDHRENCLLAYKYLNIMDEIKQEARGRWYMITIRPPHDTPFITFKEDVEKFYNHYWSNHSIDYEYAYEQIGETTEELGKGFHVHIIAKTCKINYYVSHILRDAFKTFHYTAKNCIKVEQIKNLIRAKEYIRGNKNDEEKTTAVTLNSEWRLKMGLKEIYVHSAGQVQPAELLIE